MSEIKKLYNIFKIILISGIVVLIILNSLYFEISESVEEGGISTFEGKTIADEIAKEWDSNSSLIVIQTGNEYYSLEKSEGKFAWWRYLYTNATDLPTFPVKRIEILAIVVNDNGTTLVYNTTANSNDYSEYIFDGGHFIENDLAIDSDDVIEMVKTNGTFNNFLDRNPKIELRTMELNSPRERIMQINESSWGSVEIDYPIWYLEYGFTYSDMIIPDSPSDVYGSVQINAVTGEILSVDTHGEPPLSNFFYIGIAITVISMIFIILIYSIIKDIKKKELTLSEKLNLLFMILFGILLIIVIYKLASLFTIGGAFPWNWDDIESKICWVEIPIIFILFTGFLLYFSIKSHYSLLTSLIVGFGIILILISLVNIFSILCCWVWGLIIVVEYIALTMIYKKSGERKIENTPTSNQEIEIKNEKSS